MQPLMMPAVGSMDAYITHQEYVKVTNPPHCWNCGEPLTQPEVEKDCSSLKVKYHSFILHQKTESWGSSILVMEKEGKAFGRVYWYDNDSNVVYLEGLSVDAESRRQSIGTELLAILEKTGRNLGAATVCLWVKKNTWVYNWYKQLGYEDMKDNEDEENTIWMKKLLISNKNHR